MDVQFLVSADGARRRGRDRRRRAGRHLRAERARCGAPLALPAGHARRSGRSRSAPRSAYASRCSRERAAPSAPPARVLVVDDDVRYSEWLRHHLDVLCPQASVSMLNLDEFERWCAHVLRPRLRPAHAGGQFRRQPRGSGRAGPDAAAPPARPAGQPGGDRARRGGQRAHRGARAAAGCGRLPAQAPAHARATAARPCASHCAASSGAWRAAWRAWRNLSRDQARPMPAPAAAESAQTPMPARRPAAARRPPPGRRAEALQPAGVAALLAAANAEVIPGYTLRLKIGESEKAVVYLATSSAPRPQRCAQGEQDAARRGRRAAVPRARIHRDHGGAQPAGGGDLRLRRARRL